MSKVTTDFMECHKWSSETPLTELAKYTEEISNSLKDRKARSHTRARFRQLGLSKEQAEVLVPIQPSGKYEEGRDPIDKIAQEIIDNDYSSEKIKEIAYDLASSASNPVAGSSRLTLLRNKLQKWGADCLKTEATKVPHITTESNKIQTDQHIFDEDEGFECPEHYYLEKVRKRLKKCDISSPPSKENLVDIMIMLSMRPADVASLSIDKYDALDEIWYKSNYSWYCTGYSKLKGETGLGKPRPVLSMEKDPIRAKELLT